MAPNAEYENNLIQQGLKYIAGCDEAGTGSLVADAFTSCVILPAGIDYKTFLPGINDSKQLSPEKREELYPLIKKYALSWSVDRVMLQEINTLNIYWAKWKSMRRALEKLTLKPDHILMDGNKIIPEVEIPQTAIVKGDAKSVSIAAASILAKVDRDEYIVKLAKEVSCEYGWAENKGYYTEKHVAAIKKYGKTVYHRNKFIEKFI